MLETHAHAAEAEADEFQLGHSTVAFIRIIRLTRIGYMQSERHTDDVLPSLRWWCTPDIGNHNDLKLKSVMTRNHAMFRTHLDKTIPQMG